MTHERKAQRIRRYTRMMRDTSSCERKMLREAMEWLNGNADRRGSFEFSIEFIKALDAVDGEQ